MFSDLDPLLHSQLRLAIMSLLISVESADFTFIKEQTKSTAGNLSVQLDKLSEAGYISIEKSFKAKKPLTTCRISKKGIKAFEEYVIVLKQYINKSTPPK
jgi:DNA-binding transcriptional ArsR family regulator